jgi:TonB family protein
VLYYNIVGTATVKEPERRDVLCAFEDTHDDPENRRERLVDGNVILLRRAHDGASPDDSPKLTLAEGDRPAPPRAYAERRVQLGLIFLFSLLVHAAFFALFRAEPEMMASAGEEAITVEILVGANAAAGIADARSDVEAERQTAADTREEEATREKSVKEDAARQPEPAMATTEEPAPPVEKEAVTAKETPPDPPPKPTPSTASAPAGSIGRGRMAGDANYQGLVAARLARFKRYPPEARRRREQGSALVSFTIDTTGHATSIRLVRGTGVAALDEEVQAMVQRASPFPPPPRGAAMSFSAPVSFRLN